MPAFETRFDICFQHCDPAGIVFFPRWHEMLNQTVERWFADALDYGFAEMHQRDNHGIPAIRTECDYKSPGQLGEVVTFRLHVMQMGGSSIHMRVEGIGEDGTERVTFDHKVVYAELGPPLKPLRLPDALRAKIATYQA